MQDPDAEPSDGVGFGEDEPEEQATEAAPNKDKVHVKCLDSQQAARTCED